MAALTGLTVAVAGSGAFGLVTALGLARNGAQVTLYDPAPLGDSASGVAAGMLAPALEAGLDTAVAGRFSLLRQARDLWPELIRSLGVGDDVLLRSGAIFLGDDVACSRLTARLDEAGAEFDVISTDHAAGLSPGLVTDRASVAIYTPEDWLLAPGPALRALRQGFAAVGGRQLSERVVVTPQGRFASSGGVIGADVVVVAAGIHSDELAALAPEAALLSPIKGQILRFQGGPGAGPILRTGRGYVAPHSDGASAGATMEPGLRDRVTDAGAIGRLRAHAESLFPALIAAPAMGLAGVRAATPDGLPLVGRSRGGGPVILCTGARRNGWLLAPLVADLVLTTLRGDDSGAMGAALSPSRFSAARAQP